ncbi:cytochrome c oxidase subunit II [Salinisphaera aquimarina]|uniref:cytochrome-c oxidase n=1 Tax=Salinisphaera aquimarina TaxID=2094031 RepID=A0ABV7EJG9_9GAMM
MSHSVSYLQDADQPFRFIPVQASTGAHDVDLLAYVLFGLCVVLAFVVAGLIAWFGIRYRAGSTVKRFAPVSEHRAHWIEAIFALVLLAVFLVFFYWGGRLMVDLYRPPADAMTIHVVGKQWMWKLEHPNGAREINTLHVPTGRNVRLDITSQDVIHSFYVPAFRIKHDAVPGLHTTLWFKATQTGEYRMFCAEYCGTNHSRMRGKVVVMAPADYADWLDANGHDQNPVRLGRELFRTYGCSGCHMGRSAVHAPKLAGIYGRSIALADGRTVVADQAYIRDSILQPKKQVAAGFAPIMPSFAGRISESELQQIIAYIRSLKPGDWATAGEGGDTR